MPSHPATLIPKSLGRLEKFTQDAYGGTGLTSFGQFQVIIYSSSIIRIHAYQSEKPDNFSYAVIASPASVPHQFSETADHLQIQTDTIRLTITKDTVRFIFHDQQGQLLNEDEPGLGTTWIGDQVTTYKKLQEGERFIGLGEKTGGLDRKGSAYQNWTTDAYAYHGGQDPLYCSTPFYIGIHHGKSYGIFLDNTYKTFFNFGASNNRFSSFGADAGEMNYYFISGPSVSDILKNYTLLTGRMEMPPRWSIGYQQCRYSYYPDAEVTAVARTFREKDIPADVIVLDIHYMDKYKIFTWDKKHFSDPQKLINEVRQLGFHLVVMCDPGIKKEEGYAPYESGRANNVFIKYPDGVDYEGQVWPGWCNFPDFTSPAARSWWAAQFKSYVDLGIDGFWNDMNEIATWGNALPENLIFDFDGNPSSSRRGRNVFGFQMARSTYEGTKALLKGKRPFNLTRSGFSGVQRYAAVWTGDNVSYDEHMLLGVRLVSSLGLTGIAFAGYDVGGFVGDANTKLYARWISIGALSPFFRGHTMINSRDSEPWSYGEEVEQIARNYIKLRYQLMPYLYSLYHDAATTGLPVQRSLAIDFMNLPQVFDGQFHNQYLFGPFILVAPVESTKELTKVFLPEGVWYSLFDGTTYNGGQEIMVACPIHKLPVFIRGGAVIPMQPSISHQAQLSTEAILHIYPSNTSTSFGWYQDDGETFDYQNGICSHREIIFNGLNKELVLEAATGTYASTYKKLKLVFHHLEAGAVVANEKNIPLSRQDHSFFTPLEKYDPINEPESMGNESVLVAEMSYTPDRIQINW